MHQLPGAVLGIARGVLKIHRSFSTLGSTKYDYEKVSPSTHKTRWQLHIYNTIPDVISLSLLEHKALGFFSTVILERNTEQQIFLWD